MSIIDLRVMGKKTAPCDFEYTWKDVFLYALGVGATAKELSYVYENAAGDLKVLPSFCVVPAIRAFPDLSKYVEWPRMLHGQMRICLARPLPTDGKTIQVGEVVNIFDKGKGAVYHIRITGETTDGSHLYDVDRVINYIGAWGFGGNPGPKAEPINPPDVASPDFSISYKVTENQARQLSKAPNNLQEVTKHLLEIAQSKGPELFLADPPSIWSLSELLPLPGNGCCMVLRFKRRWKMA